MTSFLDPHHSDAFRLITYCTESSVRELVWNTTSSAAPATINVRGENAVRVGGHEPRLAHHCPSLGDVVLVEPTWEWAVSAALDAAERRFPEGGPAWIECLAALLREHSTNVLHRRPRPEVVTEALRAERGWAALRAS